MTAGPRLRMAGVACLRGGRLLFEGLDLCIEAGAAAVVTGPNGVGKSSLLRLAAGLLRPAAGSVTRDRAALADDNIALDPRLTLEQALAFWARLDGSSGRTATAALGLSALRQVRVHILSAGQRRRAALARVAASGAPLWLLDEPANGLDEEGREQLAALMAGHLSEGGAILAASHQPLGLAAAAEVVLG